MDEDAHFWLNVNQKNKTLLGSSHPFYVLPNASPPHLQSTFLIPFYL